MSRPPMFSVCIPCYNHGKYVGATVESVLAQDFRDLEVVVADNASTDDSREVVRSFDDPRVRLVENRFNIGFAPNLQQVSRHARGRFINLLSSDDLMNPGALATYARIIGERPADAARLVLMSQAWEIDERGTRFQYIARGRDHFAPVRVRPPGPGDIEAQPPDEFHRGRDVFAASMRAFDTAGVFCTVTYARELWEAVEGYNSTQLFNPDLHFILKVLRLDPLVAYVNRPLYSYRTHTMGQAQQQAREKVLKFQADMYAYLMQWDEAWLAGTGVARDHQRRIFVRRDCLAPALHALARGDWAYASRLLAYAWATYPGITAREARTWATAGLLALGPLGAAAARAAVRRHGRARGGLPALVDLAGAPRGPALGEDAPFHA